MTIKKKGLIQEVNNKIPYTTSFLLDKNFAKPSYLCIAEIFCGINFHQCNKGSHNRLTHDKKMA